MMRMIARLGSRRLCRTLYGEYGNCIIPCSGLDEFLQLFLRGFVQRFAESPNGPMCVHDSLRACSYFRLFSCLFFQELFRDVFQLVLCAEETAELTADQALTEGVE